VRINDGMKLAGNPAVTAKRLRRGVGSASQVVAALLALAILVCCGPQTGYAGTEDAQSGSSDSKRVAAANSGNYRRILPDIQASEVPRGKTPRRPPRLDDPLDAAYQFHLARNAAAGGDYNLAQQRMQEALQADPSESRFRWWHSSQALRQMDPGAFVWNLLPAVRATIADPLARRLLLIQAHQAAILLLGILWSVMIVAYLISHWRYLAHALVALSMRDKNHLPNRWIPWLLIAGTLAIRPGWIGLLAVLSVPLTIQARGRNRWALVSVWVTMVFLLFPHWPMVRNSLPALDPESETNLLERASRMPPSPLLVTALEKRIAEADDNYRLSRLQLALAVQRARAGRYRDSNKLFQAVLAQEPQNVAGLVGLANNTYYQGSLDTAVQGYLAARKLAPDRGEIPYNLAQVYFKKLFIPEASEALKDARTLGFNPPPWKTSTGNANSYSPVVYLGPDPVTIAASCAWEEKDYPPLAHLASWGHFLGCPPLSLFLLLVASLALAIAVIFGWSNRGDSRNCDNCGKIICADCCCVREGIWLCNGCGETAERARSDMVLATLLKNRSRTAGMAHSVVVARMSRLFPGAGHLVLGETGRAFLRCTILAVGIYLVAFGWIFDLSTEWLTPGLVLAEETIDRVWFPVPAAAWCGWNFWSVTTGAVLIAIAYLIALLDGSNMRHRTPERFILGSCEPDQVPKAAARRLV